MVNKRKYYPNIKALNLTYILYFSNKIFVNFLQILFLEHLFNGILI